MKFMVSSGVYNGMQHDSLMTSLPNLATSASDVMNCAEIALKGTKTIFVKKFIKKEELRLRAHFCFCFWKITVVL